MTHDPFDAARVAYEQGQRDALAAAVQRVEALPWRTVVDGPGLNGVTTDYVCRPETLAAIKGEQI